ncbi:putative cytochrome c oxidase assembly factor [Trypanosoma cruzi]|uniref:Putative cytochrome c oxidase assembly factor n=1 Tax=Trypanosoma cruzi TaxID=5693 RepID=A0A2V2WA14_TRYCR|nr:putative cytochrome c oxidase assembly factor [Trypanosoma cruzi]
MRRALGCLPGHVFRRPLMAASMKCAFRPFRSQAAVAVDAEQEEIEKDKAALRKYSMLAALAVLSAGTLWYGSRQAKKRYFGSVGSARVNVETRGRPALGGPFVLVKTDGEPVTQAEFLGSWTFFLLWLYALPGDLPGGVKPHVKSGGCCAGATAQRPYSPAFCFVRPAAGFAGGHCGVYFRLPPGLCWARGDAETSERCLQVVSHLLLLAQC